MTCSSRLAEILDPLTASQREAVEHVDGPLLILAGPGSGKTRVITHRIAYLLHQGVPARSILALTFTNKAADEMRQRLQRLAPGQPVWLGTFHRFCARLLRQHAPLVGLKENFSIYDTQDSRQLLQRAIKQAGAELVHTSVDAVASAISWAKNELVTADQYCARAGSPLGWFVERVYPVYQRLLLEANAVDFDDLLLHVAVLLRENEPLRQSLDERFRYVLVDEYQDTNLAQYAIARAISRDYPNLAVAGDPDQSIYGWRGANLNNILQFEHDLAGVRVVRLERNYRSTPGILRVADQLISNNVRRKQKSLYTRRPEGPPVRLDIYATAQQEAETIAARIAQQVASGRRRWADFAVFYRVNTLSRLVENALRNANIPYQIVKGVEFYQRKEVKDVLAYLHLVNNPDDDVALRRIINVPPRQIGKRTLDELTQHAAARHWCLLQSVRQADQIETIGRQGRRALARFAQMYDGWRRLATAPVEQVVREVLVESGYWEWVERSSGLEAQERLENLNELVADAREFDQQFGDEAGLEAYLEQRALVSDVDDWDEASDRVTLMTLHAAKGLEFPVVFIIGLEQGLLPYQRRNEELNDEEEERRLLFVGITRAQDELYLSQAQQRMLDGKLRRTAPSSFLMELPRQEMEMSFPTPAAVPPPEPSPEWAGEIWSGEEVNQDPADWDDGTARRYPLRCFQPGTVVEHPQYGCGRIVTVHGTGRNRSATVHFFGDGLQRTFRLSHAPLIPQPQDD